jgi:hypothetical protein
MCDHEALADLHVELRAGIRASRVDVGARTVASPREATSRSTTL